MYSNMFSFLILIIVLAGVLVYSFRYGQTNFIEDNITVTISQGKLIGKKSVDYLDGTFYSFVGVPYAKPPIGSLRFKAPEPAEPWTGTYDATKTRPACSQPPQVSSKDEFAYQSEDCLFLSVHSKMSTDLKPVMVWIHGGGFVMGGIFENRLGPELLMSEDIVLVKIAYRVSVFGFLSIDDPKYDIHGNAGLKDQVMALKWIQKNIHHFGGDPNRVTIFGESAGGVSVHLLYLSPLSKGLFHRAIAQSGVVGNPWLTSPTQYSELAKYLNCNSENLDEIVHCLSAATTDELLESYKKLEMSEELNKKLRTGEIIKLNSITIETDASSNSFLAENPEDIVKNGKFNRVPIIMGFNTHEGALFIPFNIVQPNVTDYRTLIPRDIHIDLESKEAYELGQTIKEFYYGDQIPSFDLIRPLIDYTTDVLFLEKIYKFAKLQSTVAKDVPIYFYQFDYYTKLNIMQNKLNKYVAHTDDCNYLFYVNGLTPKNLDPNSDEYCGIHRMIKLWTTFAKTGNPNPVNDPLLTEEWLPIESDKFNYLQIAPSLELKQDPVKDRMQFWEQIYKMYNRY